MKYGKIGLSAILLVFLGMINAEGQISLSFDIDRYSVKTDTVDGTPIAYRAYEGIVYVSNPVDAKYQYMNIYIPEAYCNGGTIGRYDADTAPIFFPNNVGGYMPALPIVAGLDERKNTPNAALLALARGYVVASAGARGRTLYSNEIGYYGKAPAGIVDLKAAVAYLRYNDSLMPGSAERIVSNGTSAGGAMSALLGATGDAEDYLPFLKELGAAPASSKVFAVSAYCPITNLDHADMAYEWQYADVVDYSKMVMQGMIDFRIKRAEVSGTMTEQEQALAQKLARPFHQYLNSLALEDEEGRELRLNEDGSGSFRDYIVSRLEQSAQKALAQGEEVASVEGVTVDDGRVMLSWGDYLRGIRRMKLPPAFDALDLSSGENSLFGDVKVDARHFTRFGQDNSTAAEASAAPEDIVRMMNPMDYITSPDAYVARYWRIRHGAKDRDTSLAIPTILALKLKQQGRLVDIAFPWGVLHSGDYDLPELFDWIDGVMETESRMPN